MIRKPSVALDLSSVANIEHLHQLLAEVLVFPDCYGRNWDAFWDAITGLVDMPAQLELIGWQAFETRFPRDAQIMKKCLEKMSASFPSARVEYS